MFIVGCSGDVEIVNVPTTGEVGLDGGWEARAAWSRSCSRLRSRWSTAIARSCYFIVSIFVGYGLRKARTRRDSNASQS